MSRLLVITPTYNERDNLAPFCRRLFARQPEADLLVVDDASPDGTGDLADELAAGDERIRVLHRAGKKGLASAYIEGFARGLAGDWQLFAQMDTDLSHDPRSLPDLLARIDAGADLVVGSRNVAGGGVVGWGPGRRLLSRGGSLYARLWLGLPLADCTSGYRVLRRRVVEALDLAAIRSEGYAFLVEMAWRAAQLGFTLDEAPIVFVDRRAGASKMTARIALEAALVVPLLRFAPRRRKRGR